MNKIGVGIREKIELNNKLIEEALSPNLWTLNNVVNKLLKENEELQAMCPHEYKDGFCIYCYQMEEEN